MDERQRPADDRIDLRDDRAVQRWLDYFGITRTQLEEALDAAGDRASDVEEHLRNQGASAGAG